MGCGGYRWPLGGLDDQPEREDHLAEDGGRGANQKLAEIETRNCKSEEKTGGLLGGGIRVGAHQGGFTAEGEFEFVGNLGPEFAKHVETHVLKDAIAHALRG
jgi:hypothetical protein